MTVDKISDCYVDVNGIKLHYVRQGAGEPLMLIHGWPGFWYEWHRNIGPLAEHFDVLVPDMRGFAYSDKPDVAPEAGYDWVTCGQWSCALPTPGWASRHFG